MKKLGILAAGAIIAVGTLSTSCGCGKNVSLKTDVDSVSYALGLINGSGFKESLKSFPGEPIDVDIMLAAFAEGLKADAAAFKMTPEQAQTYFQTYLMTAQTKMMEKDKAEGEAFLAENKTKEGVVTTESGLQYKVETLGTGAKPAAADRVKVHYTGTLLDGTVFDSSIERAEPAEFGVSDFIDGWTEGLQLMPVGSKYIFWIPSELAYGEQGVGQVIKPNSALKFEVELLEILK